MYVFFSILFIKKKSEKSECLCPRNRGVQITNSAEKKVYPVFHLMSFDGVRKLYKFSSQ